MGTQPLSQRSLDAFKNSRLQLLSDEPSSFPPGLINATSLSMGLHVASSQAADTLQGFI